MAEKVLMKGNEAMAEAAMRAGCRFFFGYPITPQTEVAAYMAKMMSKVGGTYLQAESEVAVSYTHLWNRRHPMWLPAAFWPTPPAPRCV